MRFHRLFMTSFFSVFAAMAMLVGCSDVSFDSPEPTPVACEDQPGANCEPIVEEFYRLTTTHTVKRSKLDILIVNDTSGSMAAEQAMMAANFNNFISEFSGFDWQLGITTMDLSNAYRPPGDADRPTRFHDNINYLDGNLIPFANGSRVLLESDPDRRNLFEQAIQVTDTNLKAYGDERGIYTASLALERSGIVRSDSTHVAVIFLTDEDVRGAGCTDSDRACFCDFLENEAERQSCYANPQSTYAGYRQFAMTANDFPSRFAQAASRFNDKSFSVSALITEPVPRDQNGNMISSSDEFRCFNSQDAQGRGAREGNHYAELAAMDQFEGFTGSICDNFSSLLADLSRTINRRVEGDIPLDVACDIVEGDANYPIEITLLEDELETTFVMGVDPLPQGITSIEVASGRINFLPGLIAGSQVIVSYHCR